MHSANASERCEGWTRLMQIIGFGQFTLCCAVTDGFLVRAIFIPITGINDSSRHISRTIPQFSLPNGNIITLYTTYFMARYMLHTHSEVLLHGKEIGLKTPWGVFTIRATWIDSN